MPYDDRSPEGRLLAGDPATIGIVSRWIATTLATSRFWSLRQEWPDLHQETMTRVLLSLRRDHFVAGKDLRVYVQAVATYTGLAALEAQRLHPEITANAATPAEAHDGVESRLVTAMLARTILDHASEECRALINAYFLEEMSYDEIARRDGVPTGTVKSRLSRCMERLARLGAIIGNPRGGRA